MSTFRIERTLAVIKPCAVQHRFSILRRIISTGFHVLQERCVKLSVAQAEKFFLDDQRVDVQGWSCGPLIALCLSHESAIETWKKLMGPEDYSIAQQSSPTCLRALYGEGSNPLYGTDCVTHAQRELRFFFPNMSFESFPTTIDDINHYINNVIYQPLNDALFEMIQVKPNEPIEWIADYMLKHNKNEPLMQKSCPDAINLLQQLKNEKNLKPIEGELKVQKQTTCGCSVTSASSLSSV